MSKYSIEKKYLKNIEIYQLFEDDETVVEIAPELGNNCFSFHHASKPILEPIDVGTFLQKPTSYGIPILFPFPNRIRNGAFEFQGKRYLIDPSRHGFVRDKHWNVDTTGASEHEGAWIKSSLEAAQYQEEILKQFPFPFKIEVLYRLKQSTLEIEAQVQNTGERELPMGFGIHPYFIRPEHGSIQVQARKQYELEDCLPTGKLLDVEGDFDLLSPKNLSQLIMLDNLFTSLIPDSDGLVRCIIDNHQQRIKIIMGFDADTFRHVAVYTPQNRQAICIEPYTCSTDALNLYNRGIDGNLILLPPDEKLSFKIHLHVCVNGSYQINE